MKIIAAINNKNALGKNGDLLYSIKSDMSYFRENTRGKAVVMGRKTLLSLPNAQGLKNRTNFVLSRSMSEDEAKASNVIAVKSAEDLFAKLSSMNISSDDVFIIGGGEIYKAFLPKCDTLLLTHVYDDALGDTYFPEIPTEFVRKQGDIQEENGVKFSFDIYKRK